MVAGAGMFLGSASPAYSQASQKYAQPNQQELEIVNSRLMERGKGNYVPYSESSASRAPINSVGEESIVAFALYCLIKKIEGRK